VEFPGRIVSEEQAMDKGALQMTENVCFIDWAAALCPQTGGRRESVILTLYAFDIGTARRLALCTTFRLCLLVQLYSCPVAADRSGSFRARWREQ
jgi:hypothetical protein